MQSKVWICRLPEMTCAGASLGQRAVASHREGPAVRRELKQPMRVRCVGGCIEACRARGEEEEEVRVGQGQEEEEKEEEEEEEEELEEEEVRVVLVQEQGPRARGEARGGGGGGGAAAAAGAGEELAQVTCHHGSPRQ
eukprot:761946-Hanusia_phi.AAC.2